MNSIPLQTLFVQSEKFVIPSYQRAYAWGDTQRKQLLQDLEEANGSYYLGHYLFEEDKSNKVMNIIDGQQRLTTIVIFMSCMLHALKDRKDIPEDISQKAIRNTYLLNLKDAQRFHTVSYDDSFFRKEIIQRDSNDDKFIDKKALTSSSEKNIRDCRVFFDKKFAEASTEQLCKWLTLIEEAKVTYFEVGSKIEAAQIFAFQNDRGKSLTNLEVLKSYFMLQIYLRGEEAIQEEYIQSLEDAYRRIYQEIVSLKTDEDQILRYFWMAYRKGFNTQDPLNEIKEYYKKRPISKIVAFIDKLADAFGYVRSVEQSSDRMLININHQANYAWSLPVLIKAYCVANVKEDTMACVIRLVENFTFRAMVRGGRANVESRFNTLIQGADDDAKFRLNIAAFLDKIRAEYWKDKDFKEALESGGIFYRHKACSYLLWRYEESLHSEDYPMPLFTIPDETLDHIAPQTEKGVTIANGYGKYNDAEHPEEGIESGEWMSYIGNMVLVSRKHNSSMGNNPFKTKLETYGKTNILSQQRELHDLFEKDPKPLWDKNQIEKRGKKIVEAAMKIWDLNKIDPKVVEPLFE